jgi:hypothetical protein
MPVSVNNQLLEKPELVSCSYLLVSIISLLHVVGTVGSVYGCLNGRLTDSMCLLMLTLETVFLIPINLLGASLHYGLVQCCAAAHGELVSDNRQSRHLAFRDSSLLTPCAPESSSRQADQGSVERA